MLIFWLLIILFLCIIEPFATYFWDTKKLRRFPNATRFSGIFNISFILQRLRGFRSKEIHLIHQKHHVLRIGPNTISFSSPSAIKAIYGHSTPCIKGGSYAAALRSHPGLIEVIDKQQHASKRRILSHAFATRNLEEWEFKVVDKVQRLLRQFDRICLEERAGGSENGIVDFRRWANLFSVDAIVDIALSERSGCLDRGDDLITIITSEGRSKAVRFIKTLHAARRPTSMFIWSSWYWYLELILKNIPGFFRDQRQVGRGFTEIIEHLVRQRLKRYHQGEELDDLTSCLLENKAGQARNLIVEEIEGDITTLRKYFLAKTINSVANCYQWMPGPTQRP